mgnify:CR=1 FL=1|jgi:hypothetical protein
MSKTSYRENIAKDIAKQIKSIKSIRYVDRDVFDPDEISDAQFPAVLVQSGSETKTDIAMGYERIGNIEYIVTAFVKGKYIDTARNKILDEIEEKLYEDVSRGGYAIDTLVTEINTDEGVLYPLGAIQIVVRIEYIHQKGDLDKS